MSWQDSFTPDPIVPTQTQGWQSSFVPDGQTVQQPANNNPSFAEQAIRQVGLAGRDIAGAIPMALGGGADLLNTTINYGTSALNNHAGTNIPQLGMPTNDIQAALSATHMFPEYQNQGEKNVGTFASFLLGGGENLYNTAKEASGNAVDMLPKAAEDTGLVAPKRSDLNLIKEKLDLAGITPQQYADALRKSSPDEFAGELGGDPLRMQTQTQAKITGPAMQEARDAMRQRLAQAPQRTQQIIERTFFPSGAAEPTVGGDPALAASPLSQIEPIIQAQQNLVDIKNELPGLYDAAYNSSVNTEVGRRASLNVINTPAGQKAMKDLVGNLKNQGINPEDAGIVIDENNGFHGLSTKVPVSTLNELQKTLGDQVARNPLTGAIEDHSSQVIEGMRQHITNYLSENSPEFNAANTRAAANFQGTNAFELGRKLAHSAAGENADAIVNRANEAFSPQEQSYFKTGYAQGLFDTTMGAPIAGGSPAARIAKGTVTQTASDIIGQTQAQKFAEALMKEKNRVELAQRGLYGSNTAETLSAEVPSIPLSPHGLIAGATGKVMDFVNAGKNARIAQLLYATSPEQKAVLAKSLLR